MSRLFLSACLSALLTGTFIAQVQQVPQSGKEPPKGEAPPRSDGDRHTATSSSKNTQIDLSPPADDAKNHPYSDPTSSDANPNENGNAEVQEMHPWDPHRAAKNLEIGDFYFKRKNYRAAADRYQEALEYKPNDAEANFHLAQCLEKLNEPEKAAARYHEYLKILPQGPLAPEAHRALEKLEETQTSQQPAKSEPK